MALINCPECNHKISDKAKSCPECGYVMEERTSTIADLLAGHRWKVQSETLGNGRTLEADFGEDGAFDGVIQAPPDDFFLRTQQVNGRWHLAQPLLLLQWDWVQNSGTYHEEVPIEISSFSDQKLEGVDKWSRFWELERIGN